MNIFNKILLENKTIETKRLIIHPFTINSKIMEDLFEIYRDKENVNNYCESFSNFEYFNGYMSEKIKIHQENIGGIISFLINLKKENKYIGVRNIILDGAYTYNNQKEENNKNVISEIIMNKNYWNKGYATEASKKIFEFLRENEIKNILTFIEDSNSKALMLNKKLGFNVVDKELLFSVYNFHRNCEMHTSDIDKVQISVKILDKKDNYQNNIIIKLLNNYFK